MFFRTASTSVFCTHGSNLEGREKGAGCDEELGAMIYQKIEVSKGSIMR